MRIGNPQNEKGIPLLAGISIVSDGIAICSDIVAVANGSNVTVTSASNGVLAISVDLDALSGAVEAKVNKPPTNGTSNQVLATNGDGTTKWIDKGIESVSWSGITGKPSILSALPSNVGNNGTFLYVSNNRLVWNGFDNAVTQGSYNAPTGDAVNVMMTSHANNLNMHLPTVGRQPGAYLKMGVNGALWTMQVDSAAVADSAQSVPWSGVTGKPVFFGTSIVSSLPESGISSSVMYLVSNGADSSSKYDEYVYADGAWEVVGHCQSDIESIRSHISSSSVHVPSFSGVSNGMVLGIVSGEPSWTAPAGGGTMPSAVASNAGNVIRVNDVGNAVWEQVVSVVQQNGRNLVTAGAVWSHVSSAVASVSRADGDMTIASFVNGSGVVKSATSAGYASSAGRLASTVYIGNALFNGTANVTMANMGAASAVHNHSTDVWFTNAMSSKITAPTYGRDPGKVLAVNQIGTGYEWVSMTTGGGGGNADSAVWAASASRAIGDKNGNDITTAYQSKIDVTHMLDGSLISNIVANATVSAMSSSLNSHILNSNVHVPAFTAVNNGQVLKVDNGALAWATDATGAGGDVGLPAYSHDDAGKVLKVNGIGDGIYWGSDATGGAPSVHSHSVSEIVGFNSSVSTIVASMVNDPVISFTQGGVAVGSFSLNQSIGATIALDGGGGGASPSGYVVSGSPNNIYDGTYVDNGGRINGMPVYDYSGITETPIFCMWIIEYADSVSNGYAWVIDQLSNLSSFMDENIAGRSTPYCCIPDGTTTPDVYPWILGGAPIVNMTVVPTGGGATVSYVTSDWVESNFQHAITPSSKLDYSLISNAPAINNATVTIMQGGLVKGVFSLNQSSSVTINLDAGGSSSEPSSGGDSRQFYYTVRNCDTSSYNGDYWLYSGTHGNGAVYTNGTAYIMKHTTFGSWGIDSDLSKMTDTTMGSFNNWAEYTSNLNGESTGYPDMTSRYGIRGMTRITEYGIALVAGGGMDGESAIGFSILNGHWFDSGESLNGCPIYTKTAESNQHTYYVLKLHDTTNDIYMWAITSYKATGQLGSSPQVNTWCLAYATVNSDVNTPIGLSFIKNAFGTMSNIPPTFYGLSYSVSGAGMTDVDGIYEWVTMHDGYPAYDTLMGDMEIAYSSVSMRWELSNIVDLQPNLYYGAHEIEGEWNVQYGSFPGPIVTLVVQEGSSSSSGGGESSGGGSASITIDSEINSASSNPVENRAIWSALSGIGELLDRI